MGPLPNRRMREDLSVVPTAVRAPDAIECLDSERLGEFRFSDSDGYRLSPVGPPQLFSTHITESSESAIRIILPGEEVAVGWSRRIPEFMILQARNEGVCFPA
jgi:hypothetical protein